MHKSLSFLFRAEDITEDKKVQAEIESYVRKEYLDEYLAHIDRSLKGKQYICGADFTIADCHLHTMSRSMEWAEIDLGAYPELSAYLKRIEERPGIRRALALEEEG